ncbi:hypothetical protein [Alsobacter sp. R-9]
MLRIVPGVDLTDREVVDALVVDALRHGRPVPKPVADAFWSLVDGDEGQAFVDRFAIRRSDVPDAIDTRRLDLLAPAMDDARLEELEDGADPTAGELRRWQEAWIEAELRGDDPDVAGAICLLQLQGGGGAVAAAILFGHEAYGYRVERIGFFPEAGVAFDAMRHRFLLSWEAVDWPDA